jgi:methyl-accepting chemotaxis protein
VKGSSEEMLHGSQEVITESKNLGRVTEEISGSVNEMVAGANEINQAVTQVNNITRENRTQIAALMEEVAQFKVQEQRAPKKLT